MGRWIRGFFALDFENRFAATSLKLLLFWNPLWTLLVSALLGGADLDSIRFRWQWSIVQATLVVLTGLVAVRAYRWGESLWRARRGLAPAHHGTGWHLLFLAFLAPPSLYFASMVMVGAINRIFVTGGPIPMRFPWEYYGKEILWIWAFFLLCFSFVAWQEKREASRLAQFRTQELERERLEALLAKLKDQINPHFLFNTLNTVAALIPSEPQKAEQVVVKLSSLYQGILAATRRTVHPLGEELEFCRDYLGIERIRFGDRLKPVFDLKEGDDVMRCRVPVLLLQPLVENAVKHGLSSRATGGSVRVGARRSGGRLDLWVEDDGVGFGNSPYAGSGTALENCRKRIELQYGKEGRLGIGAREGGGTRIEISLPAECGGNGEDKA